MTAPLVLALAQPLIGVVEEIIQSAFPDSTARETKRLEYSTKIMTALTQLDVAQMEVNKAEAASASLFVAGWRPFIGWVGGVAIAFQFAVKPMLLAFGSYFSESFMTAVLNAPQMDSNMWELVTAMLGIGAMRSYEKLKGVASK